LGAQLQGASLEGAHLQGASFRVAQLLGASLENADIEATDLTEAHLWRTNHPTPPTTVAAIRMSRETWLPEWRVVPGKSQPWDDKAYQALLTTLESIPPSNARDRAVERAEFLDCSSTDKTLASCDPSAQPPPEAASWRKMLEATAADEKTYTEALAKTLKTLVCSGGGDAIHVMHGVGFQAGLEAARGAAIDLISNLTNKESKDCPVAAALTDADRAKLLQIKQQIEAAKTPGGQGETK
jgi:Pentapeptide repeats (8 copies)